MRPSSHTQSPLWFRKRESGGHLCQRATRLTRSTSGVALFNYVISTCQSTLFLSRSCYTFSGGYSLYCQENLRRALVLSSASSHFRHVAFDTPELWNKIPLYKDEGKAIGKVSSLLQHCIARAPNATISVSDKYSDGGGGDLRSAIEILFASDTTRKVKALELYSSLHAS
ncbi:hypothetical protein AGABI1DRAFT_131682 [Agaricus bisporus var. burnettii JB137-S8]|uniref:Uncharacterized protein n=1 Tax=Agaricus bisporus var. burnettii (strain JB137-S8 / ATCC MYA-4627 / FGSC 10392) TaxID=597362 RepID=K5WZB1_AGABU|nr:uncharacterized protein AGABI1DRAFT_131682 [Agaricus bisporus var. burnettii JB137-S8]EKM75962.1 hypothetical protein AGABI1DRAFT_131682 [Agaricus bisporus var. burnettii JB137-S8]